MGLKPPGSGSAPLLLSPCLHGRESGEESPLHQHRPPSHGWETEVPVLRRRGNGCFSQHRGMQKARGASQGLRYAGTSSRGLNVPRSSPVLVSESVWAVSKFRQTHVPQLVLGARVGGSGTPQLWGLVDGGTWLDPTPALPRHPAPPVCCPLADLTAWRGARTASAGPLKLLPSQRKQPFCKRPVGSANRAAGEQGGSGRGALPIRQAVGSPLSSYTPPGRVTRFH